jgi:type IV pilus assembly protein PilF
MINVKAQAMTESNTPLRVVRTLALWLATLCLVAVVSGCASGPAKTAEGPPDAFTESDVPETRKRAINRLRLAILYFQDGKNSIALDEVKQAIAADPNWFESYNMRGLIFMRTSEFAMADASFQKALSINPVSSEVRHNYGVLLCKQKRVPEALAMFRAALSNPAYGQPSNTLMEQGICQLSVDQKTEAESSFLRSFEMDAGNPSSTYYLALLMFQRGEAVRAQFYARRLNNSERATAESLWLGVKIERRMENRDAMAQLGGQLRKRFPQSREASSFERGAFDE